MVPRSVHPQEATLSSRPGGSRNMERMSLKNTVQEDCMRQEREGEKAAACAPVVTHCWGPGLSLENDTQGFMGLGRQQEF